MKKVLKSLGLTLLYIITYYAAVLIVGIAVGIFLAVKMIASGQMGADAASGLQGEIAAYTGVILLATSLVAFMLLWLIFVIRKKSIFSFISLRKIGFKETGIIVAAGVSLNFLVHYIMQYMVSATALKDHMADFEKLIKPLMDGSFIGVVFTVGIVAPVFEEILFRGLIYNELRKSMPAWVSVLLQAVAFAIFHGNWVQGVYTVVIGIVFALVYIWLKSIWAAIAIHVFYNMTSVLMSRVPDQSIFDSYSIVFISLSLILGAIAFYFLWKFKLKDEAVEESIEEPAVVEEIDSISI